MNSDSVEEILRCPCQRKAGLSVSEHGGYICNDKNCAHSTEHNRFALCQGKPVLIGFSVNDTVCTREMYDGYKDQLYVKRRKGPFLDVLRKLLYSSETTRSNADRFIAEIQNSGNPVRLLVVGSGSKGTDTDRLWANPTIRVTVMDIYPSDSVDYIADAHDLPFAEDSFEGVWIQAVLEHVIDPNRVVAEIHRVLKPSGIVYSETPFMQQVHEGAYDFTRFTALGHRALFGNFEALAIGPLMGPATVLAWSIKYLVWAISRSRLFSIGIFIPLIALAKLIDALLTEQARWDGASATFFLGRKRAASKFKARDVIALYRGLQ